MISEKPKTEKQCETEKLFSRWITFDKDPPSIALFPTVQRELYDTILQVSGFSTKFTVRSGKFSFCYPFICDPFVLDVLLHKYKFRNADA